jgi:hypothetical protein
VFKLTPPAVDGEAWTEQVLHAFAGGNDDGANPSTGVTIGTNGSVFGTTPTGAGSGRLFGTGCGTVYQLTPPANGAGNWIEAILCGGDDGGDPSSSLTAAPSGAFYSVTGSGGGLAKARSIS